jgi:putative Mn2+ efflux pump MntP
MTSAPANSMQIFVIGTIILILLGIYYIIQAFVTKDKED